MVEEQFVRMYVRDFAHFADRAEGGQDVAVLLERRISEAQNHARLMDSRKAPGHLLAVIDRVRATARSMPEHRHRISADPAGVAERREQFLLQVAERLEA